jgi:hypothetical protein
MANLTVTIDGRVLKRARIKAIEEGTSVNRIVSDYLERWAGSPGTQEALAGFVELAVTSNASSDPAGRSWRRDDLYNRPKSIRDR